MKYLLYTYLHIYSLPSETYRRINTLVKHPYHININICYK